MAHKMLLGSMLMCPCLVAERREKGVTPKVISDTMLPLPMIFWTMLLHPLLLADTSSLLIFTPLKGDPPLSCCLTTVEEVIPFISDRSIKHHPQLISLSSKSTPSSSSSIVVLFFFFPFFFLELLLFLDFFFFFFCLDFFFFFLDFFFFFLNIFFYTFNFINIVI
jgi:hypothetical protein